MEKIDDFDPRIVYSSGWAPDTSDNINQFNGTVHLSAVVDATATFKFLGLSVTVYGTADHYDTPAISEYSVDNEPPFQLRYQPEERVYNYVFYQSRPLGQGNHTLVIKNKANTFLWIDYLVVTPHEIVNTTITTSKSATSLSAMTTSTPSIVPLSASTTLSMAPVATREGSHLSVNLGLTIGTTVGGTVVLVLLLIVAIRVKRRRQVKYKVDPLLTPFGNEEPLVTEALPVASEDRLPSILSSKRSGFRGVVSSSRHESTPNLQQQHTNQPRTGPVLISRSALLPPLHPTRTNVDEEAPPAYHSDAMIHL
ncbi:hypothetical protein AMATHDRAFT_4265 [Amanita thiersii Skay4041]|uniref:Uncharacterized protein n=1 Tax=Amanita thiersii Skay4041 TaxID=703135 RepID=A0A2A9NL98_9AGAR|nr:hypothetical protein AMATHDRAFT_4265 [Amanita thiersii Skay4041]